MRPSERRVPSELSIVNSDLAHDSVGRSSDLGSSSDECESERHGADFESDSPFPVILNLANEAGSVDIGEPKTNDVAIEKRRESICSSRTKRCEKEEHTGSWES